MFLLKKLTISLMCGMVLAGCSSASSSDNASAEEVVIYSNADQEAVEVMQTVLDAAGYEGQYILQSFGTGELGGRLLAEGKNTEADLVTMSAFYLESAQARHSMFQEIDFTLNPKEAVPNYYAPILSFAGAIILNTQEMATQQLPQPTSVKDLAKPIYKNKIAMVDPNGSSTGWLFVQDITATYGMADKGQAIMNRIRQNAGPNLELSGSGPLKKVMAGEVPIGFGMRHQAVAHKAAGLPIDYIDPSEGSYTLSEAVAVLDKGADSNPNAMKMAEIIVKQARPQLLEIYPTVVYEGETVAPDNQINTVKTYAEPLTAELLDKHRAFFHDQTS
ncbi:ABC transporter substrate-binding protein [Psychrobacter sp. F1192]|uniref:ABC transporter substrate-binding protein n=1 Tax=Psychrobacter coccoides TaxID=2818440 RepID=A0ABS3NP96_9GAMM|nr:ABC transporter substrate-binding protein [Psychrobacter coccoides]MBO1531221.1 ABC transporter substrate-binding protein [Psychrobacter coccoides]